MASEGPLPRLSKAPGALGRVPLLPCPIPSPICFALGATVEEKPSRARRAPIIEDSEGEWAAAEKAYPVAELYQWTCECGGGNFESFVDGGNETTRYTGNFMER